MTSPAGPMGTDTRTDAAGDDARIKEASLESFASDVLLASREVPVIVDFWAEWCGPCKQLTPLLERLVRQARGAVRLVKVNADANRELAAQLRIQSLPTVMAFYNGQPVDGFVGALPESQIKSFIQRLSGERGPSALDELLAAAKAAFEAKDLAGAAQTYAAVLQEDAANPVALAGLARCYLAHGDATRAEQTLALVPPESESHADVASARAALELSRQPAPAEDVAVLKQRLAADPKDHQARFDLALAASAQGDRETAVTELLEIIRRDRNWNDGAARQQLLKLFEAFGPADPVTVSGRRRLSSLLFS